MGLMSIGILSSCEVTEDGYRPIDESFFKLDVSDTSLTFGAEAGATAEFKISSTVYWQIECQDHHFRCSPSYGSTDAVVTVTAESNNSQSRIVASVNVEAPDNDGDYLPKVQPRVISLIQEAGTLQQNISMTPGTSTMKQ